MRFAELVAEGVTGLDEIAFVVSAHAHRELDVADQMARLDDLAARCPASTAGALCRWLAHDEGFRGNAGEYYDPRNSFLDRVLDRRLGIPITLSVLAIEVGRRRGVPLVPIGMPGHFLVRELHDGVAFYDPYAGGEQLDLRGCEERFHRIHGAEIEFSDDMALPTPRPVVVERLLANLHRIYLQRNDRSALTWVLRLRVMVNPNDVSVRRQLAGVLATVGIFWEAADHFDVLARLQPDRAEQLAATADRLRRRVN